MKSPALPPTWRKLALMGVAGLIAVLLIRAAAPPAGPQIALPRLPLDLGRGRPGEVVDGSFAIRNVGGGTLRAELNASCGCSDLNPRQVALGPGEIADVRVGIRLAEEGTEKLVHITITSNDDRSPSVVYRVSAACPAPLRLTPPAVAFGNVSRGAAPEARVEVGDPDGRPLGPTPALEAHSDNPHVRARLVHADAAAGTAVLVSLDPGAPAGHLGARVRLRRAGLERDVEIPVSANVLGPVMVAPSSIRLRATGNGAPEASVLVWRPDGGTLGALTKVEAPAGVLVEEAGAAGPRRRLRIRPPEGAAPSDGQITLHYEGIDEPVVIPFRSS